MRNQKVLVFVDWYLPGYKGGGITTSCAALIQRLDGYFDFSIVTRDHDYRSNAPYPNIESNKWVQLTEHTRIKYLSHSRLKPIEIYRQIKSDEYDSVYVNSFFSFYFSILPLLLVKLGFIKTREIGRAHV